MIFVIEFIDRESFVMNVTTREFLNLKSYQINFLEELKFIC